MAIKRNCFRSDHVRYDALKRITGNEKQQLKEESNGSPQARLRMFERHKIKTGTDERTASEAREEMILRQTRKTAETE